MRSKAKLVLAILAVVVALVLGIGMWFVVPVEYLPVMGLGCMVSVAATGVMRQLRRSTRNPRGKGPYYFDGKRWTPVDGMSASVPGVRVEGGYQPSGPMSFEFVPRPPHSGSGVTKLWRGGG